MKYPRVTFNVHNICIACVFCNREQFTERGNHQHSTTSGCKMLPTYSHWYVLCWDRHSLSPCELQSRMKCPLTCCKSLIWHTVYYSIFHSGSHVLSTVLPVDIITTTMTTTITLDLEGCYRLLTGICKETNPSLETLRVFCLFVSWHSLDQNPLQFPFMSHNTFTAGWIRILCISMSSFTIWEMLWFFHLYSCALRSQADTMFSKIDVGEDWVTTDSSLPALPV